MSAELQRITTTYVDTEDRIRLAGELSDSHTVVMWLTQRLLTRLVPHLLTWLEKGVESPLPQDIALSLSQFAAQSDLEKQTPVHQNQDSESWVVLAVDISSAPGALLLQIRGAEDNLARVRFTSQQLHQWLGLMRLLWRTAEWPDSIWPDWLDDTPPTAGTSPVH